MIDHLLGRPSTAWKRTQVFLVILFWTGVLKVTRRDGPRKVPLVQRANAKLRRFSPYQIILSTLTIMYAVRHLDSILGLSAPEPLARLYSRSYYRATWITTALDAGFATAMPIRPLWVRHIFSVLFSGYYLIYANEADEKLRKMRALCTVEMLRTTWEKTSNPILKLFSWPHRPSLPLVRRILLPRPSYKPYHHAPISAFLFSPLTAAELAACEEIILDFPGGGFICMSPEHHEERLRMWARQTHRPVLSIDYGKAPEYPYPWAIEEGFDAYRTLVETNGRVLGLKSQQLRILLSGDSAGGNLICAITFKILEFAALHPDQPPLPRPIGLVLSYPALNFNFTSWMSPRSLSVMQREQSGSNVPGLARLAQHKDHMSHRSPLSVTEDVRRPARKHSWRGGLRLGDDKTEASAPLTMRQRRHTWFRRHDISTDPGAEADDEGRRAGERQDGEQEREEEPLRDSDKPLGLRVRFPEQTSLAPPPMLSPEISRREQDILEEADEEEGAEAGEEGPGDEAEALDHDAMLEEEQAKLKEAAEEEASRVKERAASRKAPIGTRLTMTSHVGFFQDRIISPSMLRAMAILYIGPRLKPDFESDYYLSPVLAPDRLLAHFPPVSLICGEKDPLCDDTIIFAGRIRQAKLARKVEVQRKRRAGKVVVRGEGEGRSGSRRDPIEEEDESDWISMKIYLGWSHGFMQMPAIMPEAKGAITDLGEWMIDCFDKHAPRPPLESGEDRSVSSRRKVPPPPTIEGAPVDPSAHAPRSTALSVAGFTVSQSESSEPEEVLSFSTKKRRPSTISMGSAETAKAKLQSDMVDASPLDAAAPFVTDAKKVASIVSAAPSRHGLTGAQAPATMTSDDTDGSVSPSTTLPTASSVASALNESTEGRFELSPLPPSSVGRRMGETESASTEDADEEVVDSKEHGRAGSGVRAGPLPASLLNLPSRRPQSLEGPGRPSTPPLWRSNAAARSLSSAMRKAPRSVDGSPGRPGESEHNCGGKSNGNSGKDSVAFLTEAELLARRRQEAVFGLGETSSALQSEEEGEGEQRAGRREQRKS